MEKMRMIIKMKGKFNIVILEQNGYIEMGNDYIEIRDRAGNRAR